MTIIILCVSGLFLVLIEYIYRQNRILRLFKNYVLVDSKDDIYFISPQLLKVSNYKQIREIVSERKKQDTIGEKIYNIEEHFIRSFLSTRRVFIFNVAEKKRYDQDFIIQLTHEIKTPLSVIFLCIDALREEFSQKHLDKLEKESEKISNLSSSIIDLFRINNIAYGQQFKTNVIEVLGKSIEFNNSLAGHNHVDIDFAYSEENNDVYVGVSSYELFLVFSNLLQNAIKYSPAYSSVSVQIKLVDDSLTKRAHISFIDEGFGIAEDEMKLITEYFYKGTNASKYKSYGLGLGIVKEILNKYNGRLFISSTLDKGSKFEVVLSVV